MILSCQSTQPFARLTHHQLHTKGNDAVIPAEIHVGFLAKREWGIVACPRVDIISVDIVIVEVNPPKPASGVYSLNF
jgi:hypothetical protein